MLKQNIQEISLSKIVIDKSQPRPLAYKAKIPELAEDIKERGQLIPIIVAPFRKEGQTLILGKKALEKPHKYWMVDGERRYHALTKLGFKNALAIIRDDVDLINLYRMQFATNTKRIQISRFEMAVAIKRYRKELLNNNPDTTNREVLKQLVSLTGYSTTYYDGADLINSERIDIKKHIEEGRVSDNLPAEIHGAIKGKEQRSVESVKDGIRDAYSERAKKSEKHSPLDVRAIKTELRIVVDDEEILPEEKQRLAKSTIEHFWSRKTNEQDSVSDFYHYRQQVVEFKRQIKKWNVQGLKERQLGVLSSMLIELNDYFREERRKVHGRVGSRKR